MTYLQSIISEWCFVPTEREHLIEAANVELEALRRRAYTAMVLMECASLSYLRVLDHRADLPDPLLADVDASVIDFFDEYEALESHPARVPLFSY